VPPIYVSDSDEEDEEERAIRKEKEAAEMWDCGVCHQKNKRAGKCVTCGRLKGYVPVEYVSEDSGDDEEEEEEERQFMREKARALFKKYDADGNGSLDLHEIGAVAKVRTRALLSDEHGI
jgi:hypothetical protein